MQSFDVTHARSSSISPPNKQTHTRALTDHPFPVEPLGRATVRVAMVTKYSSNDELSGNTTSWGKFITCLCMCVFVSWLWAQVHPRDMCTLPLLYAPHTNDGPFSAPSVKALKIADDTTLASMRDGSAGCHRRVQTNKLELNVQKTIEIQVSHFHRHSPTHPLLDIVGSRMAQLLERHHSNRETCFSALCSDLNGGEGQRDRMLINKASHYYKIIGIAVSMGELLKFPRIIIFNTPKILPTI